MQVLFLKCDQSRNFSADNDAAFFDETLDLCLFERTWLDGFFSTHCETSLSNLANNISDTANTRGKPRTRNHSLDSCRALHP